MLSAERLRRLNLTLTHRFALLGGLGMLAVSLITMADVVARWIFRSPIPGRFELAALVMAVVVVACFPAGLAAGQNVTVTVLGRLLGRRIDAGLNLFGGLATLVFLALMGWQFARYARETAAVGETTAVALIPIAPFWWAVLFCLVLCLPVQAVAIWLRLLPRPEPREPGSDDQSG